ncbi:MAG TPA: acyltransferase [Pyrinomonadaceae bacterium]|jgi:peptidoglycan/LPS O-acetylase OafA/YrhL
MRSKDLDSNRVKVLDPLRGLAALWVAWYHFSGRDPLPLVKWSGKHGYLGVHVFFVISGFVIPYALSRSDYRLKAYPRFLLKRLLRLEPPYLVSILIVLAVVFLSYAIRGFQGELTPPVTLTQILLHLGYVNVFFGYEWLLPVYWTLAIEFQFYLSIGLLYPLISNPSQWVRDLTLLCVALTFLITPSEAFVFHYVFLFLLGIVTFQYRTKLIDGKGYLLRVVLLLVCLIAGLGVAVILVGLLTALAIAFVNTSAGPLKFFGKISYSVYLTHACIGSTILDYTLRRVNGTAGRFSMYAVALATTILSAYLLYRLVELPAQRWSASVSYERKPQRAAVPALIDTESL